MLGSLLLLLLDEEEDVPERKDVLRSLRDNSDPFEMTRFHFEGAFRLTKEACHYLIGELYQHDKQPTSMPFVIRFFTVLYFYANGSYQKCVGNYFVTPMSQPSVSRTIHYISELITRHKYAEVSFPTTNNKQLAIKAGFFSNFGIKGVIGAIDCTHITITCPPKTNPAKPCNLYMNRKSYYSLNVEAVSDHNLKILAINANFPGSVHDSGIWATSKVRNHMRTLTSSWLLGDQGYPLEPWLMTPFSTPSNREEEKYNKVHCKARNVVERCFGVLKSRFRCLLKERTLYYRPEKVIMIVNACAILHNIMMDKFPDMYLEIVNTEDDDDDDIVHIHDNLHSEGVRVRQQIVNSLNSNQ